MKKKSNCVSFIRDRLRKFLLLLLLFTVSSLGTIAGNQQIRLTLSYENATLTKVISDLRSKTSLEFIYSSKDVRSVKNVSFSVKDERLGKVLDLALKNSGLKYKINSEYVSITKEDNQAKEDDGKREITGKVVDEKGNPIPGVTVIVQGTKLGTTTDNKGNFSLKIPNEKELILKVSF